MKSQKDPRHNARKLALSSIFCWMFNDPDIKKCLELSQELLEGKNTDHKLTDKIVLGVKSNLDKIDKIIEECAPDWPLDKIAKVDLAILRIAICEILFSKGTPLKVAIDEAVELAKEFGNETSHKFVNGVLGTVVDDYKETSKDE